MACGDGIIRLFEPTTLAFKLSLPRPPPLGCANEGLSAVQALDGCRPATLCVSMTLDSQKVLGVYGDRSLFMWDIRRPSRITKYRSFMFHSGAVWDVKVVPDDAAASNSGTGALPADTFVTCSSDSTVRFWNINRKPLAPPAPAPAAAQAQAAAGAAGSNKGVRPGWEHLNNTYCKVRWRSGGGHDNAAAGGVLGEGDSRSLNVPSAVCACASRVAVAGCMWFALQELLHVLYARSEDESVLSGSALIGDTDSAGAAGTSGGDTPSMSQPLPADSLPAQAVIQGPFNVEMPPKLPVNVGVRCIGMRPGSADMVTGDRQGTLRYATAPVSQAAVAAQCLVPTDLLRLPLTQTRTHSPTLAFPFPCVQGV